MFYSTRPDWRWADEEATGRTEETNRGEYEERPHNGEGV
jgi:hypothetical protein